MTLLYHQEKELEKIFANQKQLSSQLLASVSRYLCLPKKNVENWFIQRAILRNCLLVPEDIQTDDDDDDDYLWNSMQEEEKIDLETLLDDQSDEDDIEIIHRPSSVILSRYQKQKLEDTFEYETHLTPERVLEIAHTLCLTSDYVEDWFINQHAKLRDHRTIWDREIDQMLTNMNDNRDDINKVYPSEKVHRSPPVKLTAHQEQELEKEFNFDQHLSAERLQQIALALNLGKKNVQDWFTQRKIMCVCLAVKENFKCIKREEDSPHSIDYISNKMKEETIDSTKSIETFCPDKTINHESSPVKLTKNQKLELDQAFKRDQNPDRKHIKKIAHHLDLKSNDVEDWFLFERVEFRRSLSKEKKQKDHINSETTSPIHITRYFPIEIRKENIDLQNLSIDQSDHNEHDIEKVKACPEDDTNYRTCRIH